MVAIWIVLRGIKTYKSLSTLISLSFG